MTYEFLGYPRSDGRVGVRNNVLVVATVGCAAFVVEQICKRTNAIPITHQQGCLQLGDDVKLSRKMLEHLGQHPNVGAVLYVGLGCETLQPAPIAATISGKPVEFISIQESGGTGKTIAQGVGIVQALQQQMAKVAREPMGVEHLIVGVKCGGSDALSGLTANPVSGAMADKLVDAGGTILLGETPGLFGSEDYLSKRFVHSEDREKLSQILHRTWEEALRVGQRLSDAEMSPGNIAGGLTTLAEKSLGATKKAGTRPIQGILDMAEPPLYPGCWIMDTPGFDTITISVQAAGGAQLIVFTTGRGSDVGNAVAPVIKVVSNSGTYKRLEEDMDINAGKVADGVASIEEVGDELFDYLIQVASGQPSKSEAWGHAEFALPHIGSTL